MVSKPVKSIFILQSKYSKNYILLIKVSKYNKRHLKIENINTCCCWDNLTMMNFYRKSEDWKELISNE